MGKDDKRNNKGMARQLFLHRYNSRDKTKKPQSEDWGFLLISNLFTFRTGIRG